MTGKEVVKINTANKGNANKKKAHKELNIPAGYFIHRGILLPNSVKSLVRS